MVKTKYNLRSSEIVLQMFTTQLSQLENMLELFHISLLFYSILCFPYILLVGILYNSRGILMFLFCFFLSYFFLKNITYLPCSYQVYIVIDTNIYSHTLPINHFLTSYLSLCLYCNLSQAQNYNMYNNLYCQSYK